MDHLNRIMKKSNKNKYKKIGKSGKTEWEKMSKPEKNESKKIEKSGRIDFKKTGKSGRVDFKKIEKSGGNGLKKKRKPRGNGSKKKRKFVKIEPKIMSKPENIESKIIIKPENIESKIIIKPENIESKIIIKPENIDFFAVLKESDVFKKIVDSLKELCEECTLECTLEGIITQCMDTSHVAVVALSLKTKDFLEYSCKNPVSLGVNLANFSKILRCGGHKDKLTLRMTDPERLEISFDNERADRTSTFELKLIELDIDSLGIPEEDYTCEVSMLSSEFTRVCRDLGSMGENLSIFCSKMGLQFSVKGDMGNGSMVFRQELSSKGKKGIVINLAGNVRQEFSMRYMNNFAKSGVLGERVILSMNEGIPLRVRYDIENLGFIQYFLAPKIDGGKPFF